MHSSRFSEMTGFKVSHGYLQHHQYHWCQQPRRQHNQHNMHQLLQSNLIFRIATMSLSPLQSTCPAFFLWLRWPSPRGLQVIATQRKKNWATITTFYSLSSFASTSFSMIISDYSSRIVSTGARLLLFAFVVLNSGPEVVTKLQRWCFWTIVTIFL